MKSMVIIACVRWDVNYREIIFILQLRYIVLNFGVKYVFRVKIVYKVFWV